MELPKKIIFHDMLLPSIILLLLMAVFHQTSLDYIISSLFYDPKHAWIYRDNRLLEIVLHKGGVKLIIGIFVIIIGYKYYSVKSEINKNIHAHCNFVLLSSMLTLVIVYFLKNYSTFSCPWNSTYFGGSRESLSFWYAFSSSFPRGHCFPAGHSSGGYAFLSIYYGYCYVYGKRNLYCLFPGLFFGIVFGVTQQMRGAHFMSHDFATIVVSIFSAWVTYQILNYYNRLYEV